MKTLEVKLPNHQYPIKIQTGLLDHSGELIRSIFPRKKVAVVTDETVWPLYGSRLEKTLRGVGILHGVIVVPQGEQSKTISGFESVCGQFAEMGLLRTDLVIAFGGGVVGDLAGFAASSYMRGIPFVQIPTTLLAQVDSAVGGKTGINLKHGKNLVGAFWQPQMVISDPELLRTLEHRQFASGMAEVIKCGAIASKSLFDQLLECDDKESTFKQMEEIIYQCCDIKRGIVERDELDFDERMRLNFGHTFGHAIERMGEFKTYTHGEAVALGMMIAAGTGETLGITAQGCADLLAAALKKYELPVSENIEIAELVPLILADKKNSEKGIRFIFLKEIGTSLMQLVEEDDFNGFLKGGKKLWRT